MGDKSNIIIEAPGDKTGSKIVVGSKNRKGVGGIVGTTEEEIFFTADKQVCIQSTSAAAAYLSKGAAQLVSDASISIGTPGDVDVNAGSQVNIVSGRAVTVPSVHTDGSISKAAPKGKLPDVNSSDIENEVSQANRINALAKAGLEAGLNLRDLAGSSGALKRVAAGAGLVKSGYDGLRAGVDTAGDVVVGVTDEALEAMSEEDRKKWEKERGEASKWISEHLNTLDTVAEVGDSLASVLGGNVGAFHPLLGEAGVLGNEGGAGGAAPSGDPKAGGQEVIIRGLTGIEMHGLAGGGIQMKAIPDIKSFASQSIKGKAGKTVELDAGINFLTKAGNRFETVCSMYVMRATSIAQISALVDVNVFSMGGTTVEGATTCDIKGGITNIEAKAAINNSAPIISLVATNSVNIGGPTAVRIGSVGGVVIRGGEVHAKGTKKVELSAPDLVFNGSATFKDHVEMEGALVVDKELIVQRHLKGKTMKLKAISST